MGYIPRILCNYELDGFWIHVKSKLFDGIELNALHIARTHPAAICPAYMISKYT